MNFGLGSGVSSLAGSETIGAGSTLGTENWNEKFVLHIEMKYAMPDLKKNYLTVIFDKNTSLH